MLIKLFKIINSKVTIDETATLLHPGFKEIYDEDLGSVMHIKGRLGADDSNGNNKEQALRLFTFLYYYCWISSPYIFDSEDRKLESARRAAHLDATITLLPSGEPFSFAGWLVKDSTKALIEWLNTILTKGLPTFGLYKELHKTLSLQLKTVKAYNLKIDKLTQELDSFNEELEAQLDTITGPAKKIGNITIALPTKVNAKPSRSEDVILDELSSMFDKVKSLTKGIDENQKALLSYAESVKIEMAVSNNSDTNRTGASLMEAFRGAKDLELR